jgi:hypothetical protein
MVVHSKSALRYHAKEMTLPQGYNWRKCHKCAHYAVELFSKYYGSVKGKFCPHCEQMERELKRGTLCENYTERTHPLYLRECAPRVLDAEHCFYD